MNTTRQQRRKRKREFNKQIKKEGKSLLGKKLLNPDSKDILDEYTASSHDTAILPFCIVFTEDSDLNDYILSCRDGAEAFQNNNLPQFIVFIREPGIELPAPKQEMMKIGTRIFRKKTPNRVFIFVEAEGNEKTADVPKAMGDFLAKLDKVPEDAPPPDWISEYIYREGKNEKEIQEN